jgi:hypothetical protein
MRTNLVHTVAALILALRTQLTIVFGADALSKLSERCKRNCAFNDAREHLSESSDDDDDDM